MNFIDDAILLKPIGWVRTKAARVPRNWWLSDVEGTLEINPALGEGLHDIHPGQRLLVLFHFHQSPAFSPDKLVQKPPHRDRPMGIFSICSPIRPNPIGLSVVEVLEVNGSDLRVRGLDMIDGTPILDLKPDFREREPGT
jgi:tRNA-Thr(GGU) m(6)t(6)A37 methyltransferase TsaA